MSILNIPQPTKERKPPQRSINVSDLFLTRFSPPWSRPPSLPASTWRNWVANQPVAMAFRETLVASLLNLEWKITPRNATYKKELEATVKYYTRLLQQGGHYLGTDYTGLIEWIAGDVLDLPFGGAAEIGRRGDTPGGRVAWIRPLDAGTLYPTLNKDFPVVQYYQDFTAVAFPDHAISRTYLTPVSSIYREGWGMAPPEKAYFAISLLNTGDKYYANLLLDVPTAGILDLGDMEKSSAEEWVTAFKTFVNDTASSFRVPVLYEHNNPVSFIPFGKVPNDIMFDKIILKYAALLGAAYGASPSDIGLQSTSSSGETLAGSIRDERKTRRTGYARLKHKIKYFFDRILPESLEFNFVDVDDELNVALGRARLATATAMNLWQTNGNLSQQEVRSQIIQEGLITISIPDKLPKDAKIKQEAKFWHDTLGTANPTPEQKKNPAGSQKDTPTEPEAVGNPKAPSGGGEGDIKKLASLTIKASTKAITDLTNTLIEKVTPLVYEAISGIGDDEVYLLKSTINNSLFDEEDLLGLQPILSTIMKDRKLAQLSFTGLESELQALTGRSVPLTAYAKRLERNINKGLQPFLVKCAMVFLTDAIFADDVVERSFTVSSDDLFSTLQTSFSSRLDELVDVYVQDELDLILDSIVSQVPLVPPEFITEKAVTNSNQPQPNIVNVTIPERSTVINVPPPVIERNSQREDDMNIIINNPQSVTLESDSQVAQMKSMTDTMATMQKAMSNLPAPVVNVNVETPTVEVNVPETIVPVPVINLSVPDAPVPPAPVINVVVDPTPITVNTPKPTKEVQTIRRDGMGNIAETTTEIKYDE